MSTLLPIDFVSRLEGASNEDSRLRVAAEAFEALLVQTLLRRMREAQLEPGHPTIVSTLRELAIVLRETGREAEAARIDRRLDSSR